MERGRGRTDDLARGRRRNWDSRRSLDCRRQIRGLRRQDRVRLRQRRDHEGESMKARLAILGVAMGMVLAAPVHAEPGIDEQPVSENNGSFLADLNKTGMATATRTRPSTPAKRCAHAFTTHVGLHLLKHCRRTTPRSPRTALLSSRRSRRRRTARALAAAATRKLEEHLGRRRAAAKAAMIRPQAFRRLDEVAARRSGHIGRNRRVLPTLPRVAGHSHIGDCRGPASALDQCARCVAAEDPWCADAFA